MTNTSENRKKLLAVSRSALRGLHELFGYDFCKPYEILHLTGKFTVGQVNRLAASAGYGLRSEIVLLTRDPERAGYYDSDLRVVKIVGDGFKIEFSRRIPSYKRINDPFGHFYRKADFDALRKRATAEAWIILQAKEHLRFPAEVKLDLTERFKLGKVDMSHYKGTYVSGVELFRRDGKGEKLKYETHGNYYYEGMWKPESVYEIFDKSGWYLHDRRENLKRRADALRAERAKTAYLNTDNADKVKELQALIDRRKAEIAAQLSEAATSDEIDAVREALGWRGLYGIVRDFEAFKDNTEARKYSSIERSDAAYNAIKSKLAKRKEAA